MPSHEIDVYVRFSETDAMGHVNNTSHFLYFEEARTKLFRELANRHNRPFHSMLVSITCDYINQAFAHQTLRVTTNVKKIGTKSFRLVQLLTDAEKGTTIARAETVTVCFDVDKQVSIPIPEYVRKGLEEYHVSDGSESLT